MLTYFQLFYSRVIIKFFILFIHVHCVRFWEFMAVTSQLSGICIREISTFFSLANYRCSSFCYCFCTLNWFTSRFLRELYLTLISKIWWNTFRFWIVVITTILPQFFKITLLYHKIILISKYSISFWTKKFSLFSYTFRSRIST